MSMKIGKQAMGNADAFRYRLFMMIAAGASLQLQF